jgi:formyltetrahydrofolate deformylase
MSSVLLLSCPDQQGIVAATSAFIAAQGGNIIHAEQYVDRLVGSDGSVFFQRIEFDLARTDITHETFFGAFQAVVQQFEMTVDLRNTALPVPTAIMASKQGHCLYDLLTRWRSGELPMDLRIVVSNHPDHRDICEHMGVAYIHLPVTKETKLPQERQVLDATADLDEGPIIAQDTAHVTHRENVAALTARGRDIETVVLARAVRAHLEHKVAVHGHKTIVYS